MDDLCSIWGRGCWKIDPFQVISPLLHITFLLSTYGFPLLSSMVGHHDKKTSIFVSCTFKHPFYFTHHMFNYVIHTGIESKEGLLLHFNAPISTISRFIGIRNFWLSILFGMFYCSDNPTWSSITLNDGDEIFSWTCRLYSFLYYRRSLINIKLN